MDNTYQNSDSIIKNNVREMLSREDFDKSGIVNVFSLPANNFIFERILEELYPDVNFVFTCVEGNPLIHQEGLTNLAKNPLRSEITYLRTRTTDYFESIQTDRTVFDIIWLDYCCQYYKGIIDDLKLVNNLIHRTTIVGVTLMGRREIPLYSKKLKDKVGRKKKSMKNVRQVAIPNVIEEHLDLRCNKMIRYRDNIRDKKASPMYLYIANGEDKTPKRQVIELTASVTYA